ncbi:MAG: acyl-CoA desaturase [Bauldia sp.]|nr:acyl-CoA desaturase [Bauldia sp.]
MPGDAEGLDDIVYPSALPFILIHVAGLGAIFTGVSWSAVALCIGLYVLRIFAIGAGYHRYFSHRAYATSRWFQFALAFLAQTSAQKSVLWWASKHRHHHLHSDTVEDVHSPRHKGFWYSHFGWLFTERHRTVELVKVDDLARYPELRWLNDYELVPALLLAVICFLAAGWQGLIVGFVWSTIFVYHATFAINSVAHVFGRKRYVTGDDSRNNWVLAFFTMGEGWHNNHHAFQSSVRQGFRWWEIDPTYYILRGLQALGLVWDLKKPPEAVLRNEQKLGSRTIERAAAEVAATFDIEHLIRGVKHALEQAPNNLAEARRVLTAARDRAVDFLATVHLPPLPTRADIHSRAVAILARTKSLDAIVDRAHRMVLEKVWAKVPAVAAT